MQTIMYLTKFISFRVTKYNGALNALNEAKKKWGSDIDKALKSKLREAYNDRSRSSS